MNLNYINYYILKDYTTELFKSEKYLLIISLEIILIILLILLFYSDVVLQIFAYYFLSPSITFQDQEIINNEIALLRKYSNPKDQYQLVCQSGSLSIKDLSTNIIIPALTLSDVPITNCQLVS